jgi:hypothetical protein
MKLTFTHDVVASLFVIIAGLCAVGYLDAKEADEQAAYEKNMSEARATKVKQDHEANVYYQLTKKGEAMTFPLSAYTKTKTTDE